MNPTVATRTVDVVVAGGGPAGIAAAISAASLGADVLLLETSDRLGGNVAHALVHTLCGLFHPSKAQVADAAHAGLVRAFHEKLAADGACGDVEWAAAAGYVPMDPDAFAALAATAVSRAGVDVKTGTGLVAVESPRSDYGHFLLRLDDEERTHVMAWVLVDATGDATAAMLAGVAVETAKPADLQHPSCIVRVDDVEPVGFTRLERARTTTAMGREATGGRLGPSCASVLLRPAQRPGSLYATLNLPKPAGRDWDPMDRELHAAMLAAATEDARGMLRFLRAREAFRRAVLGRVASRIGIRESRRARGIEVLSGADVLAGRRRDDEACPTTWPVEVWSDHRRLDFRAVEGTASIPLAALVADHPSRRLAVAGRCASADRDALGAVRVIGTAMAMGEAAGVAAGMAVASRGDLASVDPAKLRRAVASGVTAKVF